MKRHCKNNGDRSRAEDDAEVDRISMLPDELLLHIFSSLPAEDIIPTSVLSKRWKYLWKKTDNLKFYAQSHTARFADNVLQALITHQGNPLHSLSISVSYLCEAFDLGVWTQMAFARNVSKLVFRLNNLAYPVSFPSIVLERSNSLRILKLMGNINLNLNITNVKLNCLKELHLYHVKFHGDYSLCRFLTGCPNVEELVVEIYNTSGVRVFTIDMLKLQRLTIGIYQCSRERIMIRTPCLEYLNICRLNGVRTCVVDNIFYVDEAIIAEPDWNMSGNLLDATISARRLSLPSTVMYAEGTLFYELVFLELNTKDDRWWSLLAFMLASSPKLQILNLTGGWYCRGPSHWSPPMRVADCLTSCLHTLIWDEFVWGGNDDMNVAKYILKNALQLKKATFSYCEPGNDELNQHRSYDIGELRAAEKGSHICHITFPKLSTASFKGKYDKDPDTVDFIK